jgi:hypothetical protein
MKLGRLKKAPSSGEAKTVARSDHPKKKIFFTGGMNRMNRATHFRSPFSFKPS